MPYSRRYRRYGRPSSNSLLRRLVYHLAPTRRQEIMAIKRATRGQLEQRQRFMQEMRRKFGDQYNEEQLIKLFGRGGYWGRKIGGWLGGLTGNDTIKGWAESAGDAIGDRIADVVPYGHTIADTARDIAKLTGHGAYHLDAPGTAMQVGTFAQGDIEMVNIKSREYLGAINGSAAFQLSSLTLNPGIVQSFPQLSKIAMHYEQYRFNGIVFWFHSTSGESTNSADTAIGEVMMSNQPDSSSPPPANKFQMVRLDQGKQAKPSIDQLHGIECMNSPVKFIRHGEPQEAAQDPNRFDFGKFHIAVEGCNAAVTRIGELWVTYDIDLLRSRDSNGAEVSSFRLNCTNAIATKLFDNSPGTNTVVYNSLPLTVAGNTVTFPQFICDGDYSISIIMTGVASSAVAFSCRAPNVVASANCSMLVNIGSYELAGAGAGNSSDAVELGYYVVRVNAPGAALASLTWDGSALWPSSTGVSTPAGYLTLTVTRIPKGLY